MSEQEREERFQKTLADLKDAFAVSGAIQMRHEKMMQDHAELLDKHSLWLAEQELAMRRLVAEQEVAMQRHLEVHARIDKTLEDISLKLEEATDKLNGLIGYMDGRHEPRK
jgi:hypothetical protein